MHEDDEPSSLWDFSGKLFGFGSSPSAVPATSRGIFSPRMWDTNDEYETLPSPSKVPKFPVVEGRSRRDRIWLGLFALTVVFLLIQGLSAILSANYQLPVEFEQCEERMQNHAIASGLSVQPYEKGKKADNQVNPNRQVTASVDRLAGGTGITGVSRQTLESSPDIQRDSMNEMKATVDGVIKGPILAGSDNETISDLPVNVSQPENNLTMEDDGFLNRLVVPLIDATMTNETTSDVDAMLDRLWSIFFKVRHPQPPHRADAPRSSLLLCTPLPLPCLSLRFP